MGCLARFGIVIGAVLFAGFISSVTGQVWIPLVVIIAGVIWIIAGANSSHNKEVKEAKANYERALRGHSKQSAVEAGRKYYAILHHSSPDALSSADEARIRNDVSDMN